MDRWPGTRHRSPMRRRAEGNQVHTRGSPPAARAHQLLFRKGPSNSKHVAFRTLLPGRERRAARRRRFPSSGKPLGTDPLEEQQPTRTGYGRTRRCDPRRRTQAVLRSSTSSASYATAGPKTSPTTPPASIFWSPPPPIEHPPSPTGNGRVGDAGRRGPPCRAAGREHVSPTGTCGWERDDRPGLDQLRPLRTSPSRRPRDGTLP